MLLCVSFPQREAAQRGPLPQFGPPAEKVSPEDKTTWVAIDEAEKLLIINIC